MKKFLTGGFTAIALFALLLTGCKKELTNETPVATTQLNETMVEQNANNAISGRTADASGFEKEFNSTLTRSFANRHAEKNIVEIASALPYFKSLVAAVVKTGLASTLSSASLDATVFAPTDAAFAKLPAPFNNAANIAAITDAATIHALKGILLYHVLGTEVKRKEIAKGSSKATTLRSAVKANDNVIYFSNNFGLLFVNGNSLVLLADVNASNGIIHVIDDVLLPPSQNIAEAATGNANLSVLVAALVKTNLVGVFTGTGDFTVFAPTNNAFSKLSAPFNTAANINAITDAAKIAALTNILKYHVAGKRYFAWDLGIFGTVTTIAAAPDNKLKGVLGFNCAYVKGNKNTDFAIAKPVNILATNGVVHVVDQVLLP
jgi:uncharacterized surface protein with fasciclin (FAS1) repeats